MDKFYGSGVALVTPFDSNNNIDYKMVDKLLSFHFKNNTDFIVVCATTGESPCLSLSEKEKLISHVVNKCKGKIKVVAGTGSNNTKNAITLSKHAKELGADGILVVTPYYNKGNEIGIINHYKEIAKSVYPLPVILYNVPSRTGVDLSINSIVTLSKIKNIIAIKEASMSLEKIEKEIYLTKDNDFYILSGNDNLLLPILAVGGKGVISVAANIIPSQMHDICKNNDSSLFYENLELINSLFLETNPILIKEAMNYINFNVGKTRLPLHKSTEKINKKLHEVIDKNIKNISKNL